MDHVQKTARERLATESTELLHERERQLDERQVLVAAIVALFHTIPRTRDSKRHRVCQRLDAIQIISIEIRQRDHQRTRLRQRVNIFHFSHFFHHSCIFN